MSGVIRRTEYEHQIDGDGLRRETVETQDLAQHSVEVGTNTKGELSLRSSKFYYSAGDDILELASRQQQAIRLALAAAKGELSGGMTRGEADWRDVAYALADAIYQLLPGAEFAGDIDEAIADVVKNVRAVAACDPRGPRVPSAARGAEDAPLMACVRCGAVPSVFVAGEPMCAAHGAQAAEKQLLDAPPVGDAPALDADPFLGRSSSL